MKRRDFITLLGGAAAWPLTARAQQGERVQHIGSLQGHSADNPAAQSSLAAFTQRLQELGWAEGRNLHIDYYCAAGDLSRTRAAAASKWSPQRGRRQLHVHLRGFASSVTPQIAAAVIPPSATRSKTSSGVPIGVIFSNSRCGNPPQAPRQR